MALISKLFSETASGEYRLAQNLVAMAMADGSISKEEYDTIVKICQSEGISADVVDAYLRGDMPVVAEEKAASAVDRADYLSKLIQVMAVDGTSTQTEIFLLEVIAGKLGASRMELLSLVLTNTSRRKFTGDTCTRALRSFLKNIIDPKSKTLQENEDNLRAIVNMMAEQIHRHLPQDDNEAFTREMEAASALLTKNDVLNREFSSMGLNFKRTLLIECKRAVMRDTYALQPVDNHNF